MKLILQSKYRLHAAIIFALLLTLLVQWSRLGDPFQVEEDFRTLFWLQNYADSNLYPKVDFDLFGVTRYQLFGMAVPVEDSSPGYSGIYLLGTRLLPLSLFHQLLPFLILAVSVYYAYRLGEKVKDGETGFYFAIAFAILNLTSSTEISVIGGLHRSFVCLFLLALLYYLVEKRYWPASLVLFLSGVIYIPIFPASAMVFGLTLISWRRQERFFPTIDFKGIAPLLIAVIGTILLLSPMLIDRLSPVINPPATVSANAEESLTILNDPTYQAGGRRPLFLIFPILGRGGVASHGIDLIHLFFISIFSGIFLLSLRGQRWRLPLQAKQLILAGFIGWGLAWASIILLSSFLFYVPSRHTQSILFLTGLLFVVANFQTGMIATGHWLEANRRRVGRLAIPIATLAIFIILSLPQVESPVATFFRSPGVRISVFILLAVLVGITWMTSQQSAEAADPTNVPTDRAANRHIRPIILISLGIVYVFFLSPPFLNPPSAEREYLTFIDTLPKDVLISGNPCSLDNVPFFGKRQVLFSCERYRFLTNEAETVTDTLLVHYTESEEEFLSYCADYQIDYFVINRNRFKAEAANLPIFFEPYHQRLEAEIRNRSNYILADRANLNEIYADDQLSIIQCGPDGFRS